MADDDKKIKDSKGNVKEPDPIPTKTVTQDPPAKDPEKTPLKDTDTSKFTEEQKNDYIDKLKDENARRRIENKKINDQVGKLENATTEATKKLEEVTAKLAEYEGKEKEKTLAEKTEIERLQIQMQDIEKGIADRDQKITSLEAQTKEKDLKIEDSGRIQMVERLAVQLGINFTSEYERKGLMNEFLERKDNEFKLIDDEVIDKLQTFAKENKRTTPANTPGPGPQSRTSSTPLTEEIKALTSKPDLTLEDRKRLDELLVEINKAKLAQG